VQVTVEGDAATSGERSFVGSQRLDFQPGERVDFRFESAELGEVHRIRLRLAPAPNLAHNLGQAAIAHLKAGGEVGLGDMGHLRRWHLSHAIVTHAKTMQVRRTPLVWFAVDLAAQCSRLHCSQLQLWGIGTDSACD
jgi:hypothetical protein